MKKLGKLLIVCILIVTLSGCGKVIPKTKDGDEVVVKSDQGEITATELYEELKSQYGTTVLTDMIDRLILNEKYEEDDEEKSFIEEQINTVKEYAKKVNYSLEQYLKAAGFVSVDDAEEYLKLNYRREKAAKEYIKSLITDKEIEKYYEEKIKQDINCKHILISPETTDGMTDDEKKAAKDAAYKKAMEVIEKLNNGESFDDLVSKYSDDEGSKSKNGDLGWFNTGSMLEAFENAAYALKKGEYSTTPVETTYGYHIIYKVDEKEKAKLKDVKDEIISTLSDSKLEDNQSLYYEALENMRVNSKLEFFDTVLEKEYNTYINSLKNKANS